MKCILPCFLCLSLLFNGFLFMQRAGESQPVMEVQNSPIYQVAENDTIQVVAKRPYIKRGEVGVLALKCTPNNNCKITYNYRIRGKDLSTTRNIISGKDGSVLCTWKVEKNTDTGTYDIEIVCGSSRLVTSYVVQ